jgi:hypothetical protein
VDIFLVDHSVFAQLPTAQLVMRTALAHNALLDTLLVEMPVWFNAQLPTAKLVVLQVNVKLVTLVFSHQLMVFLASAAT